MTPHLVYVGEFEPNDGVIAALEDAGHEVAVERGIADLGAHLHGADAIVRGIAEAHGWVLSLIEGKSGGARFEFTDVDAVESG